MKQFDSLSSTAAPVSKIMHSKPICVKPNYSIKTTIETFKVHKISCAPVITDDGKILGIISEHDLLIQAGSKAMDLPIDYNSKVTAIVPEATIKELLILFYTKKLKHVPVVDRANFVLGIVSRIDLLSYLLSGAE
jgi:acetoin utilization protein AcuB